MVAKFLDLNNGEFLQQQKKTIGLDSNFTRALRFFVHFLGVVARRRHETC